MCDIKPLLEISKYFTLEYINKKLTEWFEREIELINYEFGEGTGKGDSYLSEIYRITFHGKVLNTKNEPNVSIKVITKCLPKNAAAKLTFRTADFFKNEINFYTKVLPELIEFQSKKNISDPFHSYPRLLATYTDGKDDFIILEDLTFQNYSLTIRQQGVDYNHATFIIRALAKFHALSFAFKAQEPDKFTELQANICETWNDSKYWNWYKKFWNRLCKCVIDAVEKEFPDTKYDKKIKEFATDATYFKAAAAATEKGKTAVFSHGDCWTSNFLIKYLPGTNVPLDIKMIDFQWCRCASPILDLSVFIFACTTRELRKQYYDTMLHIYYNTLSEQIKSLGSDPNEIYPWELFLEEVEKYSFFGIVFSLESTPILLLEPEEAFDMSVVKENKVMDIGDIWTVEPIKTQKGRLRHCGNIIDGVDKGYI